MKDLERIKKSDLKNMVWLHDPTQYEYVRKSEFTCHHYNCKPLSKRIDEKIGGWLLVGYEKPRVVSKLPDGFKLYKSIYFWLKNYDRGMPDQFIQNGYGVHKQATPSEAVVIVA